MLLNRKRNDIQYADVVESIKRYGFRRPSKFVGGRHCSNDYPGHRQHFEGHHRLAAAIDLGYKYVPYVQISEFKFDPQFMLGSKEDVEGIVNSPLLFHPDNPLPLCMLPDSPYEKPTDIVDFQK